MRKKNPLRHGFDYPAIFTEQIGQLHRRWDGKQTAEVVTGCCRYVLKVLANPHNYVGPVAGRISHSEFCDWYWKKADLFLDVHTTLRRAWHNPTDSFRAQIFIGLHHYITTSKGEFVPLEEVTDKEISEAMDAYWGKKISISVVKKARQLLSSKGKRGSKKSL